MSTDSVASSHAQRSIGDLPRGGVVKTLPCKAGDVGSIPGWGTQIPRALEQLRPDTVK